jgi:hypothetical protein
MLVRYRTTGNQTLANFQTDLNNIITGGITGVSNLTTPAQTYSSILGSYPSGIYSRVNATTFTYSKAHNVVSGYTHYFRFGFSATQLTTLDLAQSYTSGTDTLINTYQKTGLNIGMINYDPNYPIGMDIIVSNKGLFIQAIQSNQMIGIVDLGHSGVTRAYTSSMLMAHQDMQNVINYGSNTGVIIPYTYSFDTLSYVTTSGASHLNATPIKKFTASSNLAVMENPVFVTNTPGGSTLNLMYSMYKLPTSAFSGIQTYQDSNSLYRLSMNDYAILIN